MAETIIDACNRVHKELYNLSVWLYEGLVQNADEGEAVKEVIQACEEFLHFCTPEVIDDLVQVMEED